MSWTVVVTKPAEADLLAIGDYIAFQLKEPETALQLLCKIEEKVMELRDFPTRCAVVREAEFCAQGYRKLFVENYTIFFTLSKKNETVYIHRVLYNKRNWIEII